MSKNEVSASYPRHLRLWQVIRAELPQNDLAHDALHVLRVYRLALWLAEAQQANADLAGAAALVHDLVNVPKESPQRALGSELSADAAKDPLTTAGYEWHEVAEVHEAVRTCSWSRGFAPTSAIGAILQDADRLDAIGAIGIARTHTTAQCIRLRGAPLALYHPEDPLAMDREPDDSKLALDHFPVKLLRLAEGMHSDLARQEAERRQQTMVHFLTELERELHIATLGEPKSLSVAK